MKTKTLNSNHFHTQVDSSLQHTGVLAGVTFSGLANP